MKVRRFHLIEPSATIVQNPPADILVVSGLSELGGNTIVLETYSNGLEASCCKPTEFLLLDGYEERNMFDLSDEILSHALLAYQAQQTLSNDRPRLILPE